MDVAIIVFAILLILIGIVGSILPALPGPPLAYVSLILLLFHSNQAAHPSVTVLVSYGVAVAVITALDFFLPVWATKKFGGSKAGERGSIVGLILSFFIPIAGPFTIIIGPFIGAFVGELMAGNDQKLALNSAFGSFLGFIAGAFAKLAMIGLIIFKFYRMFFPA